MPSKVKVFIWRLARHSLPTTEVLKCRNMSHLDACPLCGCEDSWRHALLSCTMARCTWAPTDDSLVPMMTDNTEPSARNWLFELYDTLDHKNFSRMVVTMWSIWYARRKAIHEAIFQSPHQTFSFVNSYLRELDQLPKQEGRQAAGVTQTSE